MTSTNAYTDKFIQMKREFLDLKTAQQLAPRIRSYSRKFTMEELPMDPDKLILGVRITYEDGSGDILTEFTSDNSIWAGVPEGNEQVIHVAGYTGSGYLRAPIYIMSTRQVADIEIIQ